MRIPFPLVLCMILYIPTSYGQSGPCVTPGNSVPIACAPGCSGGQQENFDYDRSGDSLSIPSTQTIVCTPTAPGNVCHNVDYVTLQDNPGYCGSCPDCTNVNCSNYCTGNSSCINDTCVDCADNTCASSSCPGYDANTCACAADACVSTTCLGYDYCSCNPSDPSCGPPPCENNYDVCDGNSCQYDQEQCDFECEAYCLCDDLARSPLTANALALDDLTNPHGMSLLKPKPLNECGGDLVRIDLGPVISN